MIPVSAIPAIVRAADFAAPIFEERDWRYGWTAPNVPTRDDLILTIAELVETLMERPDNHSVSSGRFHVTVDREDDEILGFDIHLRIADTWDSDD